MTLKQNDLLCFDLGDNEQKVKGFVNVKERPEMEFTRGAGVSRTKKYVVCVEEYVCHLIGDRKVIEIVKIGPETGEDHKEENDGGAVLREKQAKR